MPPISRALAKGLAYLSDTQLKDGSFVTQVSATRNFKTATTLHTTCTPALILGALAQVDGSEAIKKRLAGWLLRQKGKHWSFNYWPAEALERQTRPYPDDLDDTFCALIGLYLYDKTLLDGNCLARVVRLLTSTETQIGGPYRTWLVSKTASADWQDVDLAVNTNVAYFLRLIAKPLPNLTTLIEKAIRQQSFKSPYYPVEYVILYYLARAYQGPLQADLAVYITRKQQQGYWQTPLCTALSIAALAQLGWPVDISAVDFLRDEQQADGSWPAEAAWLDEVRDGQEIFAGSTALTTAFVLEALAGASRQSMPQTVSESGAYIQARRALYEQIIKHATQQTDMLQQPLRRRMRDTLQQVERADKNQEIVLLPYMFAESLARPHTLSDDFFVQCGLANLYGWLGYTIYDDFLDDEGQPQLLSVANVAMRRSFAGFSELLPASLAFRAVVRTTFDAIDEANAWEVETCRFEVKGMRIELGALPAYDRPVQLAERSIGHMLGPVAVLVAQGFELDDPRVAALQKGFRHYLAARQLNDDLHDWQQDFQKGQITYVVKYLLNKLRIPPGSYSLQKLMSAMEYTFWQSSLKELCRVVQRQTALSRTAYQSCGLFTNGPLMKLLDSLDMCMSNTLQEQRNAAQFLAAYRQTKNKS